MSDQYVASILVVDDEKEIQATLARSLKYKGYDVDTASSVAEAKQLLNKKIYDVVVSDIVMPNETGVELLRHIRDQFPMIKVIMMTGYVTLENALTCMRKGAETLVFKPINDMHELEESIKKASDSIKNWKKKLLELKNMKVD